MVPCRFHHDWRVILRHLSSDQPGMTFGVIRDGKPDDPKQGTAYDFWQLLGANKPAQVTAESDAIRLATDLGLTGPEYIPFPLAEAAPD